MTTKKYPTKSNNTGVGARPWKVKNDLQGIRFGKLTAVKINNITKRGAIWECKCDCGNKKIVLRSLLLNGGIRSCGCLKSESKKNEKNSMWKGDSVGYASLHSWVRSRLIKPDICPICKEKEPIDLSNIGHTYKRNLKDWVWLCRKCHMISDNRMDKLVKIMKNRRTNPEYKNCLNCGNKFKAKYNKQKGCSIECSREIRTKSYVETVKKQKMQGLYKARRTKKQDTLL